MAVFFIILLLVIIIYLFLNKRDNASVIVDTQKTTITKTISEDAIPIVNADEILTDENGRQYKEVIKEILTPRKTYIYGSFVGKYNGELLTKTQHLSILKKFYSFNIYECVVTVNSNGIRKDFEGAFDFEEDTNFDLDKLPKSLNCNIQIDNTQNGYSVTLREVKLNNISIERKLHQTDGNEVFGTITGNITGYVLDFLTSYELVNEYIIDEKAIEETATNANVLTKTTLATGKIESKNGQARNEYYYSDYKTTYWGNWNYTKSAERPLQEGCLTTGLRILGLIIGLCFLLALLPAVGYLLPFILIPLFFRLFSSNILSWIFRILGILLLLGFALSLFSLFFNKPSFHPKPKIVIPQNVPITDSIIRHTISWNDYDDTKYEGTFWMRKIDYENAVNYKSNLQLPSSNSDGYNRMVYELKQNDKNNLTGLYQLYDSLKIANKLDEKKFAEMVVSMTQEIPYTIVLPNACDGSLYNDKFTQQYLASSDASCDGYERFGINTPVEFMTTLKGDCDTRTLLLYTILSHYNYDVAMLSSEYYGHSLLGINLPYDGAIYNYNNQHYVLWETTAPNIKPGIISNQVANLNYWKISLKSK